MAPVWPSAPGERSTGMSSRASLGSKHACALLSDGSVTCWGDNFYGELGYGTKDLHIGDDELPSSVGPVSITTTPGLKAVDIVAGGEHTCATLSDGSVKCWGANNLGQLGQGNTEAIGDDELPSSVGPISLITTPGVTVSALAAGEQFTCAVLSNGRVKCWGYNSYRRRRAAFFGEAGNAVLSVTSDTNRKCELVNFCQ